MKLAYILLCSRKEKEVDVTTTTRKISDREVSGLQYLSGYVIQNLYKKFYNYKKYNSEEYKQTMAILLFGKTSNSNSLKNFSLYQQH